MGGGYKHLTIAIPGTMVPMLNALMATGLYGDSLEDVATYIIRDSIKDIAMNTPHSRVDGDKDRKMEPLRRRR